MKIKNKTMLFIKNKNTYTRTAHHDLLVGSVNHFHLTDKVGNLGIRTYRNNLLIIK